MSADNPTVGEVQAVQDVWDDAYDNHWYGGDAYAVFEAFCAALGLDPSRPAADTVQLEAGQHVVEFRPVTGGEMVHDGEGIRRCEGRSMYLWPVIVKSASGTAGDAG